MALTVVAAALLLLLLLVSNQKSEPTKSTQEQIVQAEQAVSTPTKDVAVVKEQPVFEPGQKVNFSLRSESGKIQSTKFVGKPLMLEFIATWCPHCQKTTPNVATALSQVPTEFIMIGAADEGDAQVADFHRRYNLPGLVGFDDNLELIRRFSGTGYPTLVYIDSEGRLVSSRSGEASVSEIVKNLRQIQN